MINLRYKNAYKEVLEIIKYLPKKDFDKIPKEKIEFFERNQNNNHDFYFDVTIPLDEQKISREANAIILKLFNDYFISDKQKEKLLTILAVNEQKYQEKQREKYNPDDIFKNKEVVKSAYQEASEIPNNLPIELDKNMNIFMKIFKYIKNFFNKNK